MENPKDLQDWRINAAKKSGGTSSDSVKDFVLRLIEPLNGIENALDFGAGKGQLLRILSKNYPNWNLAGTDILGRPENLPAGVAWYQKDLNKLMQFDKFYDLVICSEVIEHLENPRQLFRDLAALVRPGGWLILTMPNQESYRSLLSLWLRGNHVAFSGDCYPAHITALVAEDLTRICAESAFCKPKIYYSGLGMLPKLTRYFWQQISFGILKGKRFSDGLGMVAQRVSP